MKGNWLTRATACALAASAFALGGALLACSQSESEKMAHGDAVDDEVAMPVDANEMKMTEEQRRAQASAEEMQREQQEFNESGQGDDAPLPQP
jgi:cell division protein FtsX